MLFPGSKSYTGPQRHLELIAQRVGNIIHRFPRDSGFVHSEDEILLASIGQHTDALGASRYAWLIEILERKVAMFPNLEFISGKEMKLAASHDGKVISAQWEMPGSLRFLSQTTGTILNCMVRVEDDLEVDPLL